MSNSVLEPPAPPSPQTPAAASVAHDADHDHVHDHGREGGASPVRQFHRDAGVMAADERHRALIQRALGGYYLKRDEFKARYASWEEARAAAAEIKWESTNNLGTHLDEFAQRIAARGAHVHWARDDNEARDIILRICREAGAKKVIKSKTMTSEEIHLNAALEAEGLLVDESDLGEYIVQLREEAPYHFVFPAMHLSRGEVSKTFEEKLGSEPTDSPEELTMIARRVMRDKYLAADVGITGANFAIAETGTLSITENEGNARLTMSLPRVHIALMGIEKVLPKLDDLALFLPMLATAGAGQPLTCYNTLVSGPRQPGEADGPEEMHVVLLDNGRTQLLADPEQRDALGCIRCGACLNVCPVFKSVGGHAYGTTYQGPIGSVITPHLRGLQTWKHLSGASSLCGACTQACPVGIDLHHHLLHNRRNAAADKPSPLEARAWAAFSALIRSPKLYGLAIKIGRLLQPLHPIVRRTRLDPMLPWTRTREFPLLAKRSFREEWARREKAPR
jgi:L-lactate dehydrogenase complex protein LldF